MHEHGPFAYRYYSLNIITLSQYQSDCIKRLRLYFDVRFPGFTIRQHVRRRHSLRRSNLRRHLDRVRRLLLRRGRRPPLVSALRTSQGLARFRKSLPPYDVSVRLSQVCRMSGQFPGSFHFN